MKSLLNYILPVKEGDILTRNTVDNIFGEKYKIKIISLGSTDVIFERLDAIGSFLFNKKQFFEQYDR